MSQQRIRRRPRGRVPVIVLLVGLLVAMPMAAWGAWNDDATVEATASTGTVPPPDTLKCDTRSLVGIAPFIILTWLPPDTAIKNYRLRAESPRGTFEEVIEADRSSLTIGNGLLMGLFNGLRSILTGNQQAEITLTVVHESDWESERSDSVSIERRGLLNEGIGCVNVN